MISVVLRGLREHGLLRAGPDPDFHVTLTQGDAIHVRVYEAGHLLYFLKCSKFNSLQDEYERHRQAHEAYGDMVAPPRALFKAGEWSVIATAGVAAMPLRRAALIGHGVDASTAAAVEGFFRRQAAFADSTHRGERAQRLEQALVEALERPGVTALRERVMAREAWALVRALPNMPQHGDFVMSNLAWLHGRLVVFDYEDFGRIQLPGFDLTTLYLSLFDFAPDAVERLLHANDAELDAQLPWLRPCCDRLGLTFATMRVLLPIHLTAFLSLKRNYGPAVRHIAERALLALGASGHG